MPSRYLPVFCGLAVVTLLLVVPQVAEAQMQSDNLLQTIIDQYRQEANRWKPVILEAAIRLFWLLAALELSWMAIQLTLKQAQMNEWAAELVRHVMFIGFFYAVLTRSGEWSSAIVNSLWKLASQASGDAGGSRAMDPTAIFDIGLEIALNLSEAYSIFSPIASSGMAIGAFIIMVCFAFIAAFYVIALVEMYIVLNAGVILLGLGSTRWTSEYATKYLTYTFSVGMKLFVLQLLMGLGETLIKGWANSITQNQDQVFAIIGGAVVFLALVYSVPNLVQSLITGNGTGGGQAMTAAMGAVGGVAMGAALQGAGAGAAGYQATQLARQEGASGVSGIAKAAGAHLAHAAGGDLYGKMTGESKSRFGTLGGRIAQTLGEQRQTAGSGQIGDNTISAASSAPVPNMPTMPKPPADPDEAARQSEYVSGVRPDVEPPRYNRSDTDV